MPGPLVAGLIGGSLGLGLGSLFGNDSPSFPGAGLGQSPAGHFNSFLSGSGGAATGQGVNIRDLIGSDGRTAPDLFNRILAGSSRGTESAQQALSARGARSGVDSGIQQALAAAIDLEGADREAGIRAQEAALSEDRRRSDIALVNQSLIDPILAALGIETGVATNRAQISAQQGNQELQAIAALLAGLSNFG